MNKEQFLEVMKMIESFYPNKFELTNEIVENWYLCLKEVSCDGLKNRLIEYAKSNKFPPTIADLYEHYEKIKEVDDGWQ